MFDIVVHKKASNSSSLQGNIISTYSTLALCYDRRKRHFKGMQVVKDGKRSGRMQRHKSQPNRFPPPTNEQFTKYVFSLHLQKHSDSSLTTKTNSGLKQSVHARGGLRLQSPSHSRQIFPRIPQLALVRTQEAIDNCRSPALQTAMCDSSGFRDSLCVRCRDGSIRRWLNSLT